jgi:hypothetical protein
VLRQRRRSAHAQVDGSVQWGSWCPPQARRRLAAAARSSAAGQGPERLIGVLAVRVGGPGGQPLDDHRGGRGQQRDVVELAVELPLIRRAPAHEQHLDVVAGQQVLDAVLSPHPVLPGTQAGRLIQGDSHPFGQPVESLSRPASGIPARPATVPGREVALLRSCLSRGPARWPNRSAIAGGRDRPSAVAAGCADRGSPLAHWPQLGVEPRRAR